MWRLAPCWDIYAADPRCTPSHPTPSPAGAAKRPVRTIPRLPQWAGFTAPSAQHLFILSLRIWLETIKTLAAGDPSYIDTP